jgi:hypothetical protein
MTPPSPYALARLFDFLQTLPNLECLQLYSVDYSLLQSLAGAFKDYPLPAVTTLCIPGGTTLFPAFPNIQSLTFSTYAHRDTLLLAKRSFPQLHSLGGVYLTPDSVVGMQDFDPSLHWFDPNPQNLSTDSCNCDHSISPVPSMSIPP